MRLVAPALMVLALCVPGRAGGDATVPGTAVSAADRDGDGIPDSKDKCPADPEDKDGFQDQDGCPDPDNDGDGVLDVDDQCPNEPEDRDGFQDEDGCPDPDNDGDRIPDVKDKCPNVPESYNGIVDEDGCPDERAHVHVKESGPHQYREPVRFAAGSAALRPEALRILDEVAAVMKQHAELVRVEVQGNSDDREDPHQRRRLGLRRAEAVQRYLIGRGVAGERLVTRDYGSTRPLAPNRSAEERARNRRVEFYIVEQGRGAN